MADGPRESTGESCGGRSELEGRLLEVGIGDSAAISLPAEQLGSVEKVKPKNNKCVENDRRTQCRSSENTYDKQRTSMQVIRGEGFIPLYRSLLIGLQRRAGRTKLRHYYGDLLITMRLGRRADDSP